MKNILLASLVLSGAMIIGCDDRSSTPAPAALAQPTAEKSAEKMAAPAMDAAKTAGGKNTAAVNDANKTAAAAGADSMAEVTKALGGTPQEMIDKAMAFIHDNKLDDAQVIVDKLDSVKGKLPAEWAGKIDTVKSALAAAKAAGVMPAAPGMGK